MGRDGDRVSRHRRGVPAREPEVHHEDPAIVPAAGGLSAAGALPPAVTQALGVLAAIVAALAAPAADPPWAGT